MWLTQEPKKVALWNKRNFEEKNGVCVACLKYSVLIFVEKIYKCNIWRVAVRPSYIKDAQILNVKVFVCVIVDSGTFIWKRTVQRRWPRVSLSQCYHRSGLPRPWALNFYDQMFLLPQRTEYTQQGITLPRMSRGSWTGVIMYQVRGLEVV
jgi:hypothetical protein